MYGEQRDHGNGTIVVVEGSPPPLPLHYVRGSVVIQVVDKIFTPGTNIWISFSIFLIFVLNLLAGFCIIHGRIVAEKEFPVKKLDSHHGENEEKEEIDN